MILYAKWNLCSCQMVKEEDGLGWKIESKEDNSENKDWSHFLCKFIRLFR